MQDTVMLDTIERYIKGEMLPEERVFFEQLRKTNPDVDQMVVEHTIFLNQMNRYGERKDLQHQMEEVHNRLFATGAIRPMEGNKVVRLWKKYKRVVAVAASIAGITAVSIISLVSHIAPKADNKYVEQLSRKVSILEQKQNSLTNTLTAKLDEVKPPKASPDLPAKLGGTGFLIDGKGWILTNAHVVENASSVTVQNNKGLELSARVAYIDHHADLAFLKITDENFKPFASLPYGISRTSGDLGEQIFTLGYPRDEIVYGEGYMSAKTGFAGDTLACQIAVAANPGNSGGPVLNKNGEVVGILSTRQVQAQGVVFAIKSKNIFRSFESFKADAAQSDSSVNNLRISSVSTLKGMDRIQQIKKIQDCVFIVKSY